VALEETTVKPRKGRDSRLLPGAQIAGRYRLGKYLARGGMAEVWLATHLTLKSQVAIKFVSDAITGDHQSGPFALERFRFEAQVSAQLATRTKHIVAVQDAGEEDGMPYLVMEYIEGLTLRQEVELRGPMSAESFADVLDQIADALHAAHALGIVHRDLKPSNLMLIAQPDHSLFVKVADFGVAKATRASLLDLDRPRETVQGELVGSPAYMSPEQVRGLGGIDARSDLWSLGIAAYETLSGVPCFQGATLADLMVSIGSDEPRRISDLRPDLPRALDDWFARALAKEPEQRFDTVEQMAAAFRAALAKPAQRRVAVRGIAASVVILVAAAAGGLALLRSRGASDPSPAPASSAALEPSTAVLRPTGAPTSSTPVEAPVEPVAPAPVRAPPTKVSPSSTRVVTPSGTPGAAAPPPSVIPPPRPPQPPPGKPPAPHKIDPSEIQ
jgi:serine/threonine protein kinase